MRIQNRVTAAVRPSYEELAAALAAEEQAKIDETGTRQENGKAWLGTFVARRFTGFAVGATREAPALTAFLGEAFDGIVPCDRAKMSWPLGSRLRHAACELFEHGDNSHQGRISRVALMRRTGPVRRKVECLLLRGTEWGHAATRGTCRELDAHRQRRWMFLRHEGGEPTNNAGERWLRHAVIWRKVSFGTQSAGGSRFVETMLTLAETCRQQRRNAFAFRTRAVEAHLAHQPPPSLLPGT